MFSPQTVTEVARYIGQRGRFSEKIPDDVACTWVSDKEYIEYGYSPEVQAMTDALLAKALEIYRGAAGDDGGLTPDMTDTLREAMWRISLKFYFRDAWDNAQTRVYQHLPASVRDVLGRMEYAVLDQLSWSLPFKEAESLLPCVLRDQARRLRPHIKEAYQRSVNEHAILAAGGNNGAVAANAENYYQWLVQLQLWRERELYALQTGARPPGVLEASDPVVTLDRPAPRVVRKRPRPHADGELVSTAV